MRATREQQRQKKVNTRDAMAAAEEFCERRGYVMPLEYFIAIGNGEDPRRGAESWLDPVEGITVDHSTAAMREAAKYIYVPASKVEFSGEVETHLAPIQVDSAVAESLARKLQEMGIGTAPAEEEFDLENL